MSDFNKAQETLGRIVVALINFENQIDKAEANLDQKISEHTELAKEMGGLNDPEYQSVIDGMYQHQLGLLHARSLLAKQLEDTGVYKLTEMAFAKERMST